MYEVEFYEDHRGKAPAYDFILEQNPKEQVLIMKDLKRLEEHGIDLGWPSVERLNPNVWQVRTRANKVRYRFLFFIVENKAYIVTAGYKKKVQKTPPEWISKCEECRESYLRARGKNETK